MVRLTDIILNFRTPRKVWINWNCIGLGFLQRYAILYFSDSLETIYTFCLFFHCGRGKKKIIDSQTLSSSSVSYNLLSLLCRGKQSLLWGAYLKRCFIVWLTFYGFNWCPIKIVITLYYDTSEISLIYNLYADDFPKMITSIIFTVFKTLQKMSPKHFF